jgi:hypothetical protein
LTNNANALRDSGYVLDAGTIQGWALANGWTGKNPQRPLADYVRDINSGKRPHARRIHREDFVEQLRRRVAGEVTA